MTQNSKDRSMPAIPQIGFDIVDVRSVADLHIRAMQILNWQPISTEEAVLACAESAIALGLV